MAVDEIADIVEAALLELKRTTAMLDAALAEYRAAQHAPQVVTTQED